MVVRMLQGCLGVDHEGQRWLFELVARYDAIPGHDVFIYTSSQLTP